MITPPYNSKPFPSRSSAPAQSVSPPLRNSPCATKPFVVFERGPTPGAADRRMGPCHVLLAVAIRRRRRRHGSCSKRPAGRCPIPIAIPPAAN